MALGVGTQILQGWLPGSWGVLANSGAMWALAAFGLGRMMPAWRFAAAGGVVALVAASLSYCLAVDLFEGIASGPRGPVVWSIAGIAAGSSFGAAGFVSRPGSTTRALALALVAGVLIGEAFTSSGTWVLTSFDQPAWCN